MRSILSAVFIFLVRLKNLAYDWRLIRPRRVPGPVISVGNLTVGGTGKTPTIESLLHWCLSQGLSPGVVAKGYKGKFVGTKRVILGGGEFFGDEPELLAAKFPSVPVYVSKNKSEAAIALVDREKVDVLLVDDGFQHRKLHRDFDMLVIDPFASQNEWRPLPLGRMREGLNGADRANALIISRSNLLPISSWPFAVHHLIASFKAARKPVVYVATSIERVFRPSDPAINQQLSGPVALLSAIGRPDSFEAVVTNAKIEYVEHFKFKDHHSYTKKNMSQVIKSAGGTAILTTEKDFVKIQKLGLNLDQFFVCSLKNEWAGDVQELYSAISKLKK